jgi:signal recognition particle GTPase
MACSAPYLGSSYRRHGIRPTRLAKKDEQGGTEMVEIKSGNQAAQGEAHPERPHEPITQQHRLCPLGGCHPARTSRATRKRLTVRTHGTSTALLWQYTHLTRERGGVPHDDRIDALAMAVSAFAEAMGMDHEGASSRAKQEALEDELEEMLEEADLAAALTEHRATDLKTDRYRTKAAGPQRR